MRYVATPERVNYIASLFGISWQEAYTYATNTSPNEDVLSRVLKPFKEGEQNSMKTGLYFEFFSKPMVNRCFCYKEEGIPIENFSGTYTQSFKIEDIVVCPICGTGRLPLVPSNYEDYYKSGFFAEKYKERLTDFDHELEVARSRYKKIKEVIPKDRIKNVLDVGCAIGAFLNVLEEDGINAVGVELYDSKDLYKKTLSANIRTLESLEQNFTTQYFDLITIYDVLEHVYDVRGFLDRILPFLKHKGYLVVEVPDMGTEVMELTEKNQHHVKLDDFEHIWYFPERGLRILLESYNLTIKKVDRPIVGKIAMHSFSTGLKLGGEAKFLPPDPKRKREKKKSENLTMFTIHMGKKTARIGVEAGVGDVYWALLKLKDFKEKNAIEYLKIYIRDSGEYNRNISLVECLDFVDEVIYANIDAGVVRDGFSRNATAIENGKPIRLDYFFVLSEIVVHGHRVETWMPEYKADWDIEFTTKKPKGFRKRKPLVVLFSSGESLGKVWMNGFMREQWAGLVDNLNALNVKPVLMGANWDIEYSEQWSALVKNQKGFLNLVGKTTLPEALYLLKEADVMIGVISGMTILANHYRTPTIALYPGHTYNEAFCWTWTPPGYKDYLPIKAGGSIVEEIINKTKEFLGK